MSDPLAQARGRMVAAEAASGQVRDARVLDAIGRVAREEFVDASERPYAYQEQALPIGEGQTISQPLVVAMMTDAAEIQPGDHVLEIGTGSGYQAAVLAELGAEVVTVERIAPLAERARATLARLGYRVVVRDGDGTRGWPDSAPYAAIIVTAGAPDVPVALTEQLAEGGRLVLPVGPRGHERLKRFVRRGADLVEADLGPVRFVPLIGAAGWDEGVD